MRIWTKRLALTLVVSLLGIVIPAQYSHEATGSIVTTQIGFAPGDNKFAVLAVPGGTAITRSFALVDAGSNAQVWPSATTLATNVVGPTTSWIGSDATGDTYVLDFSGFVTVGTYRVVSNGFSSYPFRIGPAVYDVRANDGLKLFEVQNSGSQVSWVSLDGAIGGHAPSHQDDARLGTNTDGGGGDRKLLNQPIPSGLSSHPSVTGGWYDAGDYNKYMGNTPWAVYNLLLAYEDSPTYWNFDLNSNGREDILDHAVVALDWMQRMVWTDGSVFERVFNGYNAPFDGHPDFETDQTAGTADDRPLDSDRYADITAKSSYAFAVAARVFSNNQTYLNLAQRTWAWAYANQSTVKPKVYGGGLYFGDIEIGLTLGAIELMRSGVSQVSTTVGTISLSTYIQDRISYHVNTAKDWTNPSSWDYQSSYVLERYYDSSFATSTLQSSILTVLRNAYVARITRQSTNPYAINDEWLFTSTRRGGAFGQNDLAVSSAYDALWLSTHLSSAEAPGFYTYALNQIQWVWGRNPMGESWLATDLASEYTRNMTWKATARHPISGVVVPGATDNNANGIPDYADTGNYYYSEPSINQQALYVRTLAFMDRIIRGGVTSPDFRPTVAIAQPAAGQLIVSGSTVSIAAAASDDQGIAQVTWAVGNGRPESMLRSTGTTLLGNYTASWNTSGVSQGAYPITVTAQDTAGQTRTNTVTVQVTTGQTSSMVVKTLTVGLNEKGSANGQVQGKMNATVSDSTGAVAGALVTGHWEGSVTDTFSVITDSTGSMGDYSNATSKSGTVTFTAVIDSVTKTGWAWDKSNSVTSKTVAKSY